MLSDPTRAELKYLVERQREEIKTINEVGRLLSTSTDPQEIVRRVASYLKQTFPLALCGVLFLEQRILQVIQFTKIAQVDASAAIREICTKTGDGFPEPLKEKEISVNVEDQSAAPGQWAQASIGYLRSSQFAPLAFNGKPIGRLAVFSAKEGALTKEDRHVIDIVSDQLASALHNAFLLDELRRADRLKNDLLAVISHELRIPLTAIQEGSSLLMEGALGPLNAEQADFLATVHKNSLRLQGLIENVELASQLITNKISYAFKTVDASALLKEMGADFLPVAQSKGVALTLSEGSRPIICEADAKRLHQALAQLVKNAIQATPQGGKISAIASENAPGVEILVTDTGTGISPEELPQLLGQFSMTGGVNDRKTGGLGLGLFIAQKIIAGHGGTLELQSQLGTGTKVTISLPKARPAPAKT